MAETNLAFAGYRKNRAPAPDPKLTQVGPGTACGEYMRRFWHPVALTSEVKDLPVVLRILGEDLVLFRDLSGALGLLHRHCAHRGTSLEFGIVSTHGIRCCYHGWLYDVDGRIIETPGEPAGSRIKERVCQGAYPVIDFKGLIFAYMGPPEHKPPFPKFDFCEFPDNELIPYSIPIPCNWLQVHENSMDPIHTVFLHTLVSGTQLADAWGAMPVYEFVETPLGMIYVTNRRWGDNVWVRSNDMILPNIAQAAALFEDGKQTKYFNRVSLSRWLVPLDDTNAMTIGWRHFNDRVDPGLGNRELVGKGTVDFIGQNDERPYEERQRHPGDYDAEISQRPIAIHGAENLGSTDRGVAMCRMLLRRAIDALAKGEEPKRPAPAADGTIATFAHDTVMAIPLRNDRADEDLLGEVGKRVTAIVLGEEMDKGLMRHAAVAAKIAAFVREFGGKPR